MKEAIDLSENLLATEERRDMSILPEGPAGTGHLPEDQVFFPWQGMGPPAEWHEGGFHLSAPPHSSHRYELLSVLFYERSGSGIPYAAVDPVELHGAPWPFNNALVTAIDNPPYEATPLPPSMALCSWAISHMNCCCPSPAASLAPWPCIPSPPGILWLPDAVLHRWIKYHTYLFVSNPGTGSTWKWQTRFLPGSGP